MRESCESVCMFKRLLWMLCEVVVRKQEQGDRERERELGGGYSCPEERHQCVGQSNSPADEEKWSDFRCLVYLLKQVCTLQLHFAPPLHLALERGAHYESVKHTTVPHIYTELPCGKGMFICLSQLS